LVIYDIEKEITPSPLSQFRRVYVCTC